MWEQIPDTERDYEYEAEVAKFVAEDEEAEDEEARTNNARRKK